MTYKISIVYKQLTDDLKNQIIKMWLSTGAVNLDEGRRRVNEVVAVMTDDTNNVVGVTSIDIKTISTGEIYYFLRMYVHPLARNRFVSRKTTPLSSVTFDFLSTYEDKELPSKPVGIMAIKDNQKFSDKLLTTWGWTFYTVGPMGKQLWYKNFDGSKKEIK